MLKLTGSICVLLGGFLLRWMELQARRRSRETLDRMLLLLRQMGEEVRITRTPLPSLFESCGRTDQVDIRSFFAMVVQKLYEGQPLSDAWRTSVPTLPLSASCHMILDELGQSLHGDEEAVTKALALAIYRLSQEREMAEQHRTQEEQRITALTLSASALLVILLM